jgi:dTDP-4-dehydrorhamnose reductase
MIIAITGAKGMLATALIPLLKGHQLVPLDLPGTDITDQQAVKTALHDVDFVYHCAAYTSVDKAESEPELVHAVNVLGTENVAKVCAGRNIPLVYISTDYVFGAKALERMRKAGAVRPWREDDVPATEGVYALSKLAGEAVIRKYCKKYFIVRTAWLYGHNGRNFVDTMLALAGKQNKIRVVNDQQGSPTFAGDLASALVKFLDITEYGIYHLTGQGATTWYEFTREIFKQAGVNVTMEPCVTKEVPRPAPRPPYSVLDNAHWRAIGQGPLPSWQDGLKEYLKVKVKVHKYISTK